MRPCRYQYPKILISISLWMLIVQGCGGLPHRDACDDSLQQKIAQRIAGFDGVVGVYYEELDRNHRVSIHGDDVFPTASLIKVPILIQTMEQIESGELTWHDSLTYNSSRKYAGEDLLGSFKDGEKIVLSKLVDLMLRYSDNTASLWLQEIAGSGTAINQWLSLHRFEQTRVNSRTPGRESDRQKWGWGQTTPREMARLMKQIHARECVSPQLDDRMLRVMSGSYWRDEMLSVFPPTVQVFSKQGAVNRSRSEVVIVESPAGPFVLCVITRQQEDTSWESDNEGFVLLRDIAKLCWQHNLRPVKR